MYASSPVVGATFCAFTALAPWVSAADSLPYPSLRVVESTLLTSAKDDFAGDSKAFERAADWNGERARASTGFNDSAQGDVRAPHLACAGYGHGRDAFHRLQQLLSPEAVRPASHSREHGACFFATASDTQVAAIMSEHDQLGLESFAPFPSALKPAPGLIEHEAHDGGPIDRSSKLSSSHGSVIRSGNVEGLSVELSPGTLPAYSSEAAFFIGDLLGDLMSESRDLHSSNVWSDPAMLDQHLSTPEGAVRARDWSKAASLVKELSKAGNTSPGDLCSWSSINAVHVASDILLISGLDHLLVLGGGADGGEDKATELDVACFMGVISFFASRQEVLRISPTHSKRLLDATARAIIQTATSTDTPLTAAGLDGTGEIIQIIDSGLDETSCFFIDDDGLEVQHGYYFNEIGLIPLGTSSSSFYAFAMDGGGDFTYDSDRRKVIQYIDMVRSDDLESLYGSYFSVSGVPFAWISAEDFGGDDKAGHGTHTAGTAAGSTLNTPAETVTCEDGQTLSCVGACIDATGSDDDLVSYYYQAYDIDRQCPLFGCDDDTEACLGDDVGTTLAENGGMAQGAKLSIFDGFYGEFGLMDYAGNGLWEPCVEAGCKIHSNSWGGAGTCDPSASDLLYDDFMYQNPENLLIFAAGNDGGNPYDAVCTIGTPATAKNVLSVGATSLGETRLNSDEIYDIDHVASFSSWGFTTDGRVKPEVVAPGDTVYSAAGDGTDVHSCRLWAYQGTSMATPVVAGASAMIRQYFVDAQFYAADVTSRGFCDDGFLCEGFSPSSATVKALLINSANLMGGDSEPDGFRGFGRIHLEQGVPLSGEGDLALFVADSATTSIPENSEHNYFFEVDADAGIDFRATLSWIDYPATTLSAVQLVHDLDLAVISPSGVRYTMWDSGEKDAVNVNERVVVDAGSVESGNWTVSVSSNSLQVTDVQSYSLVVNGALTGASAMVEESVAASSAVSIAWMAICAVVSITTAARATGA